MISDSAEAREWHRIIRPSVRECLETWVFQDEGNSVTVEALETILARATVPILRQVEERPPELVTALLSNLIRTMLAPFVEVLAEQEGGKLNGLAKPVAARCCRAASQGRSHRA